jgi:hypothetical protein
MRIQDAIELVYSTADCWVRFEQFRRVRGGHELSFAVHNGRRGKKIENWSVICRGVHEARITNMDGGGLRLYSSSHPAARQYFDRHAELRWSRTCKEDEVLAVLFRAHAEAMDDWISFDSYLLPNRLVSQPFGDSYFTTTSGNNFVCRGPEFLIRVYAKALESIGEPVQVTLRRNQKMKIIRPKVLHFGSSFVVADSFIAQRSSLHKRISSAVAAAPD